MQRIDRNNPIPLHQQISALFQAQIESGQWPSHYRLKPEPELAKELGVSRGTLRRAIATLVEAGMLTHTPGRGTFVTSTVIEPELIGSLQTLGEGFAAQGVEWHTTVLGSRSVSVPQTTAALLDISPGETVFELTRQGWTDDGPVAYLVNYVRKDLVPDIEKVNFERTGLFEVLEGKYGLEVTSGRRTFSAEAAPPKVAEFTRLSTGAPMLFLEQITYLGKGQPVEYSNVWINSAKLRISSVMSRR